MVYACNETIQNIRSKFIQHVTFICSDKDHPWINNKIIKKLIHKRNIEKSTLF